MKSMPDDFHILPTPELKQAVQDCPLLECDVEGWIVCCSRRFFPLARRIAGEDELAEDVLQASWIKILQAINHARFEGPKACPWVHKVVTNTARNVHSQQIRRSEMSLREGRELASLALDPEACAREEELVALLRVMIELLPVTYRQVLELRVYQGLSSQQTAERLHISRSTVSTRLHRAVKLLKSRLDARSQSSPSTSSKKKL